MFETAASQEDSSKPKTVSVRRHVSAPRSRRKGRAEQLEKLARANPTIYRLLAESPNLERARDNLYTYLSNRERELFSRGSHLHPLESATAHQCLRVFKNVIAPRNEARAGFSTLDHLWRFTRNSDRPSERVDERSLDEGFVLEFVHLCKGLQGSSGIAEGWLGPVLTRDGIEAVDFG